MVGVERRVEVSQDELRARLNLALKHHIDEDWLQDSHDKAHRVTTNLVSNVLEAMKGLRLLGQEVEQPSWLVGPEQHRNLLSMRNGLLDLDDALKNPSMALRSHSPEWFSTVYVPYDFNPEATCPKWLAFLNEVLEGDKERIAILQQWFGLMLSGDTSFHTMLFLDGPGGNGIYLLLLYEYFWWIVVALPPHVTIPGLTERN